jgi:subtilisin-like proprotein convertase family protein
MPSVCNELRIKVNPPNAAYQIFIEIYSIVNPNRNCENVFQQFETSILLGEYSTGQYSIWVNGSFVGDIVSY